MLRVCICLLCVTCVYVCMPQIMPQCAVCRYSRSLPLCLAKACFPRFWTCLCTADLFHKLGPIRLLPSARSAHITIPTLRDFQAWSRNSKRELEISKLQAHKNVLRDQWLNTAASLEDPADRTQPEGTQQKHSAVSRVKGLSFVISPVANSPAVSLPWEQNINGDRFIKTFRIIFNAGWEAQSEIYLAWTGKDFSFGKSHRIKEKRLMSQGLWTQSWSSEPSDGHRQVILGGHLCPPRSANAWPRVSGQ